MGWWESRGLALGAVLLVGLITPVAGAAAPAGEPVIRVRLLQGERAVRVRAAGASRVRVLRRGENVLLPGPGPHRVEGRRYRGAVEVRSTADGLLVVNEVPLEAYVAGTVPAEVYPGWSQAVLRAQAVATRTYALHQRARTATQAWDVDASARSQVYGGLDAEQRATGAAVAATRGEVLTWEGRPILAVFHSASGGRTASAAEVWGRSVPYLRSVAVEGEEDSPDTYWRARYARRDLERALASEGVAVGRLERIEVVERTPSGRVRTVRVSGSRGRAELGARELRRALGAGALRSTLFEVREADGDVVFVGSGHGHGVGMSQWGAWALAERGHDYREILSRFYPGARLARAEAEPLAASLADPPVGGSR